MARGRSISVSHEVDLDGGTINIRRMPTGVWLISFEFDLERYPKARGGTVEHTPITSGRDSLEAVTAWARDEWALRKGPAKR